MKKKLKELSMQKNKKDAICGAKSRRNKNAPCKQYPMKNGRCRMHGGKSTGAKTTEGKVRSALANYKHGLFTNAAIAERKRIRTMMQWRDELEH